MTRTSMTIYAPYDEGFENAINTLLKHGFNRVEIMVSRTWDNSHYVVTGVRRHEDE